MGKASAEGEKGHGRITLRLPTSLLEELQQMADRERRSRNNKIQVLLEDACQRERERLDEAEETTTEESA